MLLSNFNPFFSHFPLYNSAPFSISSAVNCAAENPENSFPLTTFMSKVLYWLSAVIGTYLSLNIITSIETLGGHCAVSTTKNGGINFVEEQKVIWCFSDIIITIEIQNWKSSIPQFLGESLSAHLGQFQQPSLCNSKFQVHGPWTKPPTEITCHLWCQSPQHCISVML